MSVASFCHHKTILNNVHIYSNHVHDFIYTHDNKKKEKQKIYMRSAKRKSRTKQKL